MALKVENIEEQEEDGRNQPGDSEGRNEVRQECRHVGEVEEAQGIGGEIAAVIRGNIGCNTGTARTLWRNPGRRRAVTSKGGRVEQQSPSPP